MVPPADQLAPILTILGGLGAGGETSSGRRRYSQIPDEVDIVNKRARVPHPDITFGEADLARVQLPHDDALVISAKMNGRVVQRILVDSGASTDVLFVSAFNKMGIDRTALAAPRSCVSGLSGAPITPLGYLGVDLTAGDTLNTKTVRLNFAVLDIDSSYNAILGRTGLHALGAVASSYHLAMKFPTASGIGVARGNQKTARSCYVISCKGLRAEEILPLDLDPRMNPAMLKPSALEEVESHALDPAEPEKKIQLGSRLPGSLRATLLELLRENRDVFAWSAEEVPGVDPEVVQHHLDVVPGFSAVRQKKRSCNPEWPLAVKEDVQKLLEAGFIWEVSYTQGLSNVVLVRKPNGKWRVCIDFTDLNRGCPKDNYPLPRIDQMVDSTAGS